MTVLNKTVKHSFTNIYDRYEDSPPPPPKKNGRYTIVGSKKGSTFISRIPV